MAAEVNPESTVRTVVLVHGWGSTAARTWGVDDGLAGDLRASGTDVVVPVLPGHGPDCSARPEDYTDMELQLLAALPATRGGAIDAVGFSLGGKLLLRLVCAGALQVRRLVLLGVGSNAFGGEAGDAVSRALTEGPAEGAGSGFRDVIAEALASGNDTAALGAVIRRPVTPLEPHDLAALTCEVLLVVGEDDDIAKDPQPLADALPAAAVVRLPGLGHAATPHDSRVRRLVAEFLH